MFSRGRSTISQSITNRRPRSLSRSASNSSAIKVHDENGNIIDDDAIVKFVAAIESLPADEWRARTMAFESLIDSIPKPNDPPAYIGSDITPWYKSHVTLRRLFKPLSSLLLDARSTVAKHTCQHMASLVSRIKALNPPYSDTCKYLLKDLLPTVLALHAQTVKVIRGYTFEMMNIIIPLCRFKSGLPILLERLRKDKSRDVREACIKYLRLVVKHWAREVTIDADDDEESALKAKQQDYLTPSICLHLGNGLARALMDPSQEVRKEAKHAFEIFRHRYPSIWNDIVQKRDGILSKDQRLKKSIINAAIQADAEGRTEDSNYAIDEGEDYDGKSIQSNGSRSSWHSKDSFASRTSRTSRNGGKTGFRDANPRRSNSLPRSRPTSAGSGGLNGPPKRNPMNGSERPPQVRNGRISANQTSSTSRLESSKQSSNVSSKSTASINKNKTGSPGPSVSNSPLESSSMGQSEMNKESRNPSTISPFFEITNSTSSLSDHSTKPDENFRVASQLLAAHKSYIDELMEGLRAEMNTVREFEELLVQSKSSVSADGLYGPSEDVVLKYFEAVYGFLDKGTENGTKLRKVMENVSKPDMQ